jgi:hypothetical protein
VPPNGLPITRAAFVDRGKVFADHGAQNRPDLVDAQRRRVHGRVGLCHRSSNALYLRLFYGVEHCIALCVGYMSRNLYVARVVIALGARWHRDHYASRTTCAQAIDHCRKCLGSTIRSDDNLLAGTMEQVDEVQEFVLQRGVPGQLLKIVEEQDVDLLVVRSGCLESTRWDNYVATHHQLFAGKIDDLEDRVLCVDLVANRLEQMCLSRIGMSIEKERIIREARVGSNDMACLHNGVVRGGDWKSAEGIEGIELSSLLTHTYTPYAEI